MTNISFATQHVFLFLILGWVWLNLCAKCWVWLNLCLSCWVCSNLCANCWVWLKSLSQDIEFGNNLCLSCWVWLNFCLSCWVWLNLCLSWVWLNLCVNCWGWNVLWRLDFESCWCSQCFSVLPCTVLLGVAQCCHVQCYSVFHSVAMHSIACVAVLPCCHWH